MSFATGLKTIVVATDLEGRSEAALEYARKLAAAYGSRIVLAHGLDPVEYAAVDTVPGKILQGLTEQAREALEKLAGDLMREGIHSHSEVRQGAVAQMLVDVAQQYEAGLIVIGTKGIKGAGAVVVVPWQSSWCAWPHAPCWRWRPTGMPGRSVPPLGGR